MSIKFFPLPSIQLLLLWFRFSLLQLNWSFPYSLTSCQSILYTTMTPITQSCLTLCDSMDYSLPGSPVHRILQARILEWVAIILLQVTFPTQKLKPHLLCLPHCRQILYHWVTWETSNLPKGKFAHATKGSRHEHPCKVFMVSKL